MHVKPTMEYGAAFAYSDKVWELQPAVGFGEEASVGVHGPDSAIYSATL